jgi:hypothetical protein
MNSDIILTYLNFIVILVQTIAIAYQSYKIREHSNLHTQHLDKLKNLHSRHGSLNIITRRQSIKNEQI